MKKRGKTSGIDEINELATPTTPRRRKARKTREAKSFDAGSSAYYRAVLRLENVARAYAARPGLDVF